MPLGLWHGHLKSVWPLTQLTQRRLSAIPGLFIQLQLPTKLISGDAPWTVGFCPWGKCFVKGATRLPTVLESPFCFFFGASKRLSHHFLVWGCDRAPFVIPKLVLLHKRSDTEIICNNQFHCLLLELSLNSIASLISYIVTKMINVISFEAEEVAEDDTIWDGMWCHKYIPLYSYWLIHMGVLRTPCIPHIRTAMHIY